MSGIGYLSKAGLRINKTDLNTDLTPTTNGTRVTAYPTTTTIATTNAQRIGPYDQIPLLSEGLTEQFTAKDVRSLAKGSGLVARDILFKDLRGPIELQATYLGLDSLLAMAMGFEAPLNTNSPTYIESSDGSNPMTGTTTAGTTASNLEDTTLSPFVDNNIGEWVRITTANAASEGQVRRITAKPDADNLTITPAWSTNPGAGLIYEVSRAFSHIFECSKNLYSETFDEIAGSYTANTSGITTDRVLRFGTLCIEKTVSIWEFRGVMVDKLTIRHTPKDVTVTADLIAFDLDVDSSVNTDSTTWNFSAGPTTPIHLVEDILPTDLQYFRMDSWSGGVGAGLTSADNIPVSEWSITIDNGLRSSNNVVTGVYKGEPFRNDYRKITGTITVPRYYVDTFVTRFQSQSRQMAYLSYVGSTLPGDNISTANEFNLWINALELTGHSEPVAGPQSIVQTFDFECLVPATSPSENMLTPTNTNTEIAIQTKNNNPFNVLRSQNGE